MSVIAPRTNFGTVRQRMRSILYCGFEETMRKLVRSLIYQKWFYAFLAVVLWFDCWTDVLDVVEAFSTREVISLIMSSTGAILVTLIFVDLHLRWPRGGR